MGLPDVQSWKPRSGFKLTRVGIKGIKKQVYIKRPDRTVQLIITMDVSVDLPASKKGSDLSRNSEVIEEVVEQSVREPSPSLEALCSEIAEKLRFKSTNMRPIPKFMHLQIISLTDSRLEKERQWNHTA